MTPGTFIANVFAGTLAASVAFVCIGNSLPAPHGTFIPMLAGHDFVRDEFVRSNALAEDASPCVAFLGDSRVAFNISASAVDRLLPNECRAQNYGFPSLSLERIEGLLSDLLVPRTVVVSVSESMLFHRDGASPPLVERILREKWVRSIYLGQQRLLEFMRALQGKPSRASGWTWSSDQKKWLYSGLGDRAMVRLPSYRKEADDLAVRYFARNRIGQEKELRAFLANIAKRGAMLIVVIPPSEIRFQGRSEHHGPGKQRTAWRIIARVTREVGAILIDCSSECVDPSGFGDPVHLNELGAAQYSSYLAQRIATQLAAAK